MPHTRLKNSRKAKQIQAILNNIPHILRKRNLHEFKQNPENLE